MLDWFYGNLATILISLVLITVCALIILKIRRDKKQGKTSCGCGCSGCAMKDMCHAQNPQAEQKRNPIKQKRAIPANKKAANRR